LGNQHCPIHPTDRSCAAHADHRIPGTIVMAPAAAETSAGSPRCPGTSWCRRSRPPTGHASTHPWWPSRRPGPAADRTGTQRGHRSGPRQPLQIGDHLRPHLPVPQLGEQPGGSSRETTTREGRSRTRGDMAHGQPRGDAGEPPVGDQRALLPRAPALEEGRRVEHLLHAGPATWKRMRKRKNVAWLTS
jgi:hypothetical protein